MTSQVEYLAPHSRSVQIEQDWLTRRRGQYADSYQIRKGDYVKNPGENMSQQPWQLNWLLIILLLHKQTLISDVDGV